MTRRGRPDRGAATAELAVALPSLVLVLAVALAAVDLGLAQVRCVDAARVGARLLARGEPRDVVLRAAGRAAPPGAQVVLASDDGQVSVSVTGRVPGVLAPLGILDPPRSTAVARSEPGPGPGRGP
ncbi:hypothetical protein GCM10023168_29250 [Fodinibacter luteus]|uniref:Pilus assembly protein TadE n=1 Tax=Fodinibacter luteus TaxID=552064 RepID=A0ABP8KMW0_9MICO